MRRAIGFGAVIGSLWVVSACVLAHPAADGAACTQNTDCKSSQCTSGQCAGSACNCSGSCSEQGTASGDCSPGWLCVYDPPGLIGGFLGTDHGSDQCRPTCGSCPEHWSCTGGAGLCTYDSTWSAPQVTVDGPTSGEAGASLAFDVNVTFPDGASSNGYTWDFGDGSALASGTSLSHTFAMPGTYQVSVSVESTTEKYGQGMLTVAICGPMGTVCSSNDGTFGGACCGALTCTEGADQSVTCQ